MKVMPLSISNLVGWQSLGNQFWRLTPLMPPWKSFSINKTQIKTLSKRAKDLWMGHNAAYTWYGLSCCCSYVCECTSLHGRACQCVGRERHAKHFWLGDALKRATFFDFGTRRIRNMNFCPLPDPSLAYLSAAINPLTNLSVPLSPCLLPAGFLLRALTF